ncbi:lysozyme-like protein 4 isoform X3 [Mesocricetus auratus]|nr:lysozyme-like protein 4 isoform X3 [Mesocricetus auratus]XP_040595576.1 lysozyme-like protein 4 isoform X3 [Mesocricetus auratus]
MQVCLVLLLVSCLLTPIGASILGRCVVAKRLREGGLDYFEGYSLENWVCLAYFESKFNPSAVYENSEEGYTGFGLFQIRDSEWCDHGRNLCNLSCSGGSLLPGALEAAEPTHLEKAGGGNWPGLCFMLVPGSSVKSKLKGHHRVCQENRKRKTGDGGMAHLVQELPAV